MHRNVTRKKNTASFFNSYICLNIKFYRFHFLVKMTSLKILRLRGSTYVHLLFDLWDRYAAISSKIGIYFIGNAFSDWSKFTVWRNTYFSFLIKNSSLVKWFLHITRNTQLEQIAHKDRKKKNFHPPSVDIYFYFFKIAFNSLSN